MGPDCISAKVKNLSWVLLPSRAQSGTPGLQEGWGWPGRGSHCSRVQLQPQAEGQQMQCEVRMGAVRGHGPRCLPLPGPVSSWLELVSLVSCSHLQRFPDKGNFHPHSCPDPLGEVCQAVPAGAQQPCREPAEEAVPTMSPSASLAPLTQSPPPLASILSVDLQDKSNLKIIPQGPVPMCSPPGNSWSYLASAIPAIWSLGLTSCPMSFLSCWWETAKALLFPTSSKREASKSSLHYRPRTGKGPQTGG